MILRDRDVNTAWGSASDGVLESRVYFCQNWRGDVVSVLSDTGRQSLSVRYSAYGVPFGSPAGDLNADGAVNFSDLSLISAWISGSVYDVRGDINLDGVVDATDLTLLSGANYGLTLGRGKLAAGQTSAAWAPGIRKGYAGYEHDGMVNSVMHVRNRVLLGELGRWNRRDPLGYVDGMNLYEYSQSKPYTSVDPMGLARWCIVIPEEGQAYTTSRGCPVQPGCGLSSISLTCTPPPPGGGGPGGAAPAGNECRITDHNPCGAYDRCNCERSREPTSDPAIFARCCNRPAGMTCEFNGQCQSGVCDRTGQCAPGTRPTGAGCDVDEDCGGGDLCVLNPSTGVRQCGR